MTLPFSFSDDQNTSSTTKNTDKENYRETLAPDCQRMYDNFVNDIPTQETTICRLSGVEESENVILGFFFRFENFQEGLLVYGTNYDPYLHIDEPRFFAKVHCIENDQYRKLTQIMTSEEIAEKLLSFKNCSK